MIKMPHLDELHWDFADRLQHVVKQTGGNQESFYTYDGGGQRVRKVYVHGTDIEERIYLGGIEIYRKRSGTAAEPLTATIEVERETLHVMEDTRRVAMVETLTEDTAGNEPINIGDSRWRYQLDNHLGSSAMEIDGSTAAKVITYEEYHPYGSAAFHLMSGTAEVSAKRYRYTGKEKDEESGLYYHGARYYAPWLGRWTAADPAGLVDGLNLYRYSRDNPVRYSDPSGTRTRYGLNEDGTLDSDNPDVQRLREEGVPDHRILHQIHGGTPPRLTSKDQGGGAGGGSGSGGGSGGGGGTGDEVGFKDGGIDTSKLTDPNDPLNPHLDGGGSGGGVEDSGFGRDLAEVAGAASFEEAKDAENASSTGVPGGGAEKGALLDNKVGQIIAATAVIADAIATAINVGKAAFALGKVALKEGLQKLGSKVGNFFKELFRKKPPNRINSAREIIRRADEPGPFHNFPGSFDEQIFAKGEKNVIRGFYNKSRKGYSNDSIQYSLRGTVNKTPGTFEIAVRPSQSGRTELIMHRFFRPDKAKKGR